MFGPSQQFFIQCNKLFCWFKRRLICIRDRIMMPISNFLDRIHSIVCISLGLFQYSKGLFYHCISLSQWHNPLAIEAPSIQLAHCWMSTNDLIHLRLRKSWFITFIMTPAAISYQIDQNVLMELIAIGMSQTYCD